jgi:hypothetical protein
MLDGRRPAVQAPAAAVGDPADLLDVDVQQFTGRLTLIPQLRGPRRPNR